FRSRATLVRLRPKFRPSFRPAAAAVALFDCNKFVHFVGFGVGVRRRRNGPRFPPGRGAPDGAALAAREPRTTRRACPDLVLAQRRNARRQGAAPAVATLWGQG